MDWVSRTHLLVRSARFQHTPRVIQAALPLCIDRSADGITCAIKEPHDWTGGVPEGVDGCFVSRELAVGGVGRWDGLVGVKGCYPALSLPCACGLRPCQITHGMGLQ